MAFPTISNACPYSRSQSRGRGGGRLEGLHQVAANASVGVLGAVGIKLTMDVVRGRAETDRRVLRAGIRLQCHNQQRRKNSTQEITGHRLSQTCATAALTFHLAVTLLQRARAAAILALLLFLMFGPFSLAMTCSKQGRDQIPHPQFQIGPIGVRVQHGPMPPPL